MVDLTPVDFVAGLGGINALPNPLRDQANALGLDQSRMQNQAAALQLQQAQEGRLRQQQFQADLHALGNNPDANGIANMVRKYPEFSKQLQDSHNIQDEAKRDSDFRVQSQIYSAAAGGRYDLAAQLLKAHRDANVKAGEPADPTDDAIITALESNDPAEQKRALSMIGLSVASINPDKFNETYKVLNGGDGDASTVVAPGAALVRKGTGEVLYKAPEAGQLREIKVTDPVTGQETTQFVRVGGSGGGGQASGNGAPSGSGGAPLSVRTNNPGAIRFDPNNQWQGQVGNDGGFVVFDTAANGARAHQKLIANQIKGGFDTPLEWAQHYAPASDGNDPQAYAARVAAGLGIGINDKIPLSAVPKMAAISAAVESGGTPAPQGQPANAPGVVASYVTKPGAVDGGVPGDPSLTGEAYLATLPKALAAQVKALSEGRAAIPTGAALRSPAVMKLFAAASQYDPNLDQANAKTRAATRKEFTSGKAASNITSFNTVLHHIDDLQHVANDLNNGSIPLFNTIGNATSSALGGPNVAKFNAAKQAVVDELERAFRGTSGTLAGIKGWEDTLNSSSSPAQIKGVLSQMANLLAGRIEALGEQYTAGMGKSVDGINLLDSKAQTTLTSLADGYDKPAAADGGGPKKVSSRAEAMALPSGTKFIDPNGVLRVRP